MRWLAENWDTEEFYPHAAEFFAALHQDLQRARHSIDLSFYIFELDSIGNTVLEHLKGLSQRGVRIRLLVDGVGTDRWSFELEKEISPTSIQLGVHNPVPWPFSRWTLKELNRPQDYFRFWRRVNRRNHRKLVVIDDEIAYVGGINITQTENDWEDFAARVTGPSVRRLSDLFAEDWERAYHPHAPSPKSRFKATLRKWKLREAFMQHLRTSRRVWMTTGYFVPPLKLYWQLKRQAIAGADVRLLLSKKSDFRALAWLSRLYVRGLVAAGVKVHLYPHRFIHAKCILLDNEALVGSSNMNHRSYLLDNELDITLRKKESLSEIRSVFLHLMDRSRRIDKTAFDKIPFYQNWVANFLRLFKEWM